MSMREKQTFVAQHWTGKIFFFEVYNAAKGWSVDLFTTEVGAQGYCARFLLLYYYKLLGFNSGLPQKIITTVNRLSGRGICVLHLVGLWQGVASSWYKPCKQRTKASSPTPNLSIRALNLPQHLLDYFPLALSTWAILVMIISSFQQSALCHYCVTKNLRNLDYHHC